MEAIPIKKAVRQNVPALIGLSGQSGSGKTYSALLLASGMADGRKIGFIDTESGRASLYADVLPEGFDVYEMCPPFGPRRYIEAIEAFERDGYGVLIIDSMSHAWEGTGGCIELSETPNSKGNVAKGLNKWAYPKSEHKKMMNKLLQTRMDIIFCLRAREKLVQTGSGYDATITSQGLQPIQEKDFIYEMIVSMTLDTDSKFPTLTKCPEALEHMFPPDKRLVAESGTAVKEWLSGGAAVDEPLEQLKNVCRSAAEGGNVALTEFLEGLAPASKESLGRLSESEKNEFRSIANEYDISNGEVEPQQSGEYT